MKDSLDIDLAWGGYYASTNRDEGNVSVFRLLDFNSTAYHAAIFKEKFASTPTLGALANLSPFIGHAPIDAKALLRNDDLRLLGATPLSRNDLEGYVYYLEAHEVPAEEIEELIERILEFTNEPPLRLHLEIVDDELVVSERE